ncbi:ATP-binding cassette domain-containing protein [Gemella sp. GH3]|uniref:ABC transporter ATP-binding protein/permease n=1 Tax=unclassified Gemella TaxID=2624949 RepID=UPI0015D0280B|nr:MULTISPECIES: ABC transporter ATP-binding protein/permease [unclassified Gemella]MBF0714432.1 ATP-binding cassette domain-containing protein [Gemella sp. GH3.1]NYS51384.1 ATP-binding cassette domain-containing protein [Gemella sp. GH3]
MLELRNITKEYILGGNKSVALNDVSIRFRKEEFVSILGASGSGKTTMLNIIGGLDKYTSGDLLIDGYSTKKFTDKDWDRYRNGTIGFVFQSYNLISHLSVLDNVKLALSISGFSSAESTEKAKKSLEEVGLAEHIYKKPSQLSGGQMQRVAIARALVTDPKVILADEPTGALDSKTSVQIMELIKKISKDKLVIMVTHNPELAKEYSDRIVSVSDGQIKEDTNPYNEEDKKQGTPNFPKTSMKLKDSIKSSMKNLFTKKIRTILTTLAGSIGIISIALVLSISSGMKGYINKLENENMSSMPITISSKQMNFQMRVTDTEVDNSTTIKAGSKNKIHKNIYTEDALGNGETFLKYLENNAKNYYKNIEYTSDYKLKALIKIPSGVVKEFKTETLSLSGNDNFSKLSQDKNVLLNQYDVVAKLSDDFVYPTNAEEMILYVGKDNSIDKDILKALGYDENSKLDYKDFLGKEFSILSNDSYYTEKGGLYTLANFDDASYDAGVKAKIVAIVKPKDSTYENSRSVIGYTQSLEDTMLEKEKISKIVEAQKADVNKNVLTSEVISEDIYDQIIGQLGGSTKPSQIAIYPKSFEDRENIVKTIEEYNKKINDKYGSNITEANKYNISYTDLAKMMTEMMNQMINTVTIILTAFAAISLIVSSVMIGILTYVSVVERTKEIGILRAIGARKKDITRIFNVEAGLVGISSGLFGVIVAIVLSIPISNIVSKAIKADGFTASLSVQNSVLLILLSLVLTLIASVIPAKMAAKKNPVEALRTE